MEPVPQQVEWCTRKLFTQAVPPNQQDAFHENSFVLSSSAKNYNSNLPAQSFRTISKANHHFSIQAQVTPQRNNKNKIQIYSEKCSPPQRRQINTPKKYSEMILSKQFSKTNAKLMDSKQKLLPSHRTVLQSNTASKNNTFSSLFGNRTDETISVKSKKIHFTVYESKSKSRRQKSKQSIESKEKPQIVQNRQPTCESSSFLIHRFTDMTIDLSKEKRNQNIKKERSRSKSSKSIQKSFSLQKNLTRSKEKLELAPHVKRTLQKIRSYRFVDEYMQQWQIEQLLNGFKSKGEPQCRWALLVVDQVFRKMRTGPSLQALASKS